MAAVLFVHNLTYTLNDTGHTYDLSACSINRFYQCVQNQFNLAENLRCANPCFYHQNQAGRWQYKPCLVGHFCMEADVIFWEKKLRNWCASYISIWPLLVETDLFKFKQVRLLFSNWTCPISRMLLWHKSSSSFCAWTKRWLWAHKMIVHYSTKVYAQVIWEAVYLWRQSNSALFCKTS